MLSQKKQHNQFCQSLLGLLSFSGFLISTWLTLGGVPTLEHLYPAGASQGSVRSVQSTGKLDPWPPKVWISGTGVTFEPEEKNGTWKVTINANAPLGPRRVRFFNEEGASSPGYFIVSHTNDIEESEPNGTTPQANQILSLPSMVHGKLGRRHDTDMFRVHLEKGVTLVTRLDAYVLGSTTDALLRIQDSENRILTWNHDQYYLDPCLQFQAPATGYYWIQVMGFPYPANASEQLAGGDGYIYRLYISNASYIRERNFSSTEYLTLAGWNLNTAAPTLPMDTSTGFAQELATHFQRSLITARNVEPEFEPNDSFKDANPIPPNRRGVIQSPEDTDYYSFETSKGQWHRFEIQSGRLGYPTDLVLKLYDESEKEITSDDDSATMSDARIDWKSPESGKFFVRISSLTHQGGSDQVYRLIHELKAPHCELTTEQSEITVKPGESTEIKVKIQRRFDHTTPLIIEPQTLPAGVSCSAVSAEKDTKEITLVLHATPSTQAFQGKLKILGKEKDQWNHRFKAGKPTVTTTVNNGVPSGYLDLVHRKIEDLWLTVLPKTEKEK